MDPLAFFLTQFVWFFAAWSLLAYFVVWPWARELPTET